MDEEEKKEERNYKKKEKNSDFFFRLGELTFAALVLGIMTQTGRSWGLIVLGFVGTVFFAIVANKILK